MDQGKSGRGQEASNRTLAIHNSKKMVNLLHVEDEESLHMGIEDMNQ
jgi:hypothetical protein